jgi:sirohydrochlorin ferrochelatase
MPELQKYSEVIVVPVFLAPGYHVRIDLPEQLEAAGMADRARVTPALGAHPRLVASAEDRLREAGWRPGDTTVLAAAGSRDPEAGGAVRAAARALGRRLGCPVRVGYLTSAEPRVSALVEELRTDGRRVAAASWLLAPGVFQGWLDGAGADVTAAPLGVHAGVVDAVVTRYRAELRRPLHGDPEVA